MYPKPEKVKVSYLISNIDTDDDVYHQLEYGCDVVVLPDVSFRRTKSQMFRWQQERLAPTQSLAL
jgi:hypothetical protein